MINIEVKCRLPDRAAIEKRLVAMGAVREWTRRQVDTFYGVSRGWMKLREEDGRAELITYVRSTDSAAARPSEYDVLPLADAEAWKRGLGRVLDAEAVVEKERTLWLHRETRVHLDRVKDLGDFLELETVARGIDVAAARRQADDMVTVLGLEEDHFLAVPYRVLIEQRGAGASEAGAEDAVG